MNADHDATSTGDPVWICVTCGGHVPAAPQPPDVCLICADERQWIPPAGQRWTTPEKAAADGFHTEIREIEPGLTGIGLEPPIGVGQRGVLVSTAAGNVLWDPPPVLDRNAIDAVRAAGGLGAVTSSHPHMYGAIVDWSAEFDAEIALPEADLAWLFRRERPVRTWSGSLEVVPGVTLIQCGGHFPGSAALHWTDGADGRGVLLTGDTIYVTPGADRVSFLWSAPNHLPLPERAVRGIAAAVRPYRFDRIYGGWWHSVVSSGGDATVQHCAERYISFLRDEAVLDPQPGQG
ncbi:hypothetical protein CLV30_10926 [Haloactinopolyspora alba]|uniref:Metallo-beta-lactamase domain-containing protein n=1 Tax=Haloactinopolyspora alba TaxID=648780 RepID=A0A2P8DZU4_9ACTN|nr:hypothetical protein [Haloactinopolyspora alba]PSL02720.1 hypothetical protein CLV30_10926 [Haloactinopolyspora alba]